MDVPKREKPSRRWFLWGLGNILVLAGLFAVLYVGGLHVYSLGPSLLPPEETPATPQVWRAPALELTPTPSPPLPLLNWDVAHYAPLPTPNPSWRSLITRIVIPSIGVDDEVVPVGWHVEQVNGQPTSMWDVASYAVGHHKSSGNPGEGANIVLAAHSGGYGAIFRRLIEVQPGDDVVLEGAGRQFLYVVEEVLLLKEIGVPWEQRVQNGLYLGPTDEERVTLVTCWPVHVYDYRVIVLARPYRAAPFPRPDLVED